MTSLKMDPAEARTWDGLISLMTRVPAAIDSRLQRATGITHFEYRVLSVLAQQPNLQLTALAAQIHSSQSRLSHVLAKLEGQELLRREPSANRGRRRSFHATLTDRGHCTLTDAAPAYLRIARDLVLDGLDRRQLGPVSRLAEQLLNHIDKTG